jgi:transcriptional regulator with XRE-family HTH domain
MRLAMKKPVVEPAAPGQKLERAQVSSGNRGKPFDLVLSKIEAIHPGIEQEIGVSSAAMRAGRQVRQMRLAKGLTQAQLAAALGWDQVRISNIERGEGTLGPTFDVLQRIAAACDYDIEFKPRQAEGLARYAKILQDAVEWVAAVDAGTVVASPDFAAACVAFGQSLGSVKTHFQTVNQIQLEPEVKGVPFLELAARGKRMVMVPLLVEEEAGQKKSAQLEVKLAVPKSMS